MPKLSTNPTIIDDVLQFSISDLKKWGYFDLSIKSGVIKWNSHGGEKGRIRVLVSLYDEPYVELDYTWKEEQISYTLPLVSIPSNLGVGKIWFFLCPETDKRCKKLYYNGKYFLHRDAIPDAMYKKQTYCKYRRNLDRVLGKSLFVDLDIYKELGKKNFKKTYAGKPTKRYLKLIEKLKESNKGEPEAIALLKQVGLGIEW